MPTPSDNEKLYRAIDEAFEAEEALRRDKALAEKTGISLQEAALIRAWWVEHDARKTAAQNAEEISDDIKGKIELELVEQRTSEHLREIEKWNGLARERLNQSRALSVGATLAALLLAKFVGTFWRDIWMFACVLLVLAFIEYEVWWLIKKPTSHI